MVKYCSCIEYVGYSSSATEDVQGGGMEQTVPVIGSEFSGQYQTCINGGQGYVSGLEYELQVTTKMPPSYVSPKYVFVW